MFELSGTQMTPPLHQLKFASQIHKGVTFLVPSKIEVTRPKLTAGVDNRGGLWSEATTGTRRTKLTVNLWSGKETC
jgi:hypothetical protein